MYMFIYMYMYMYVYIYTSMHIYVYTYICVYACIYIHTHTHIYIYIYIYMHKYVFIYIYTYTYIYINVCIHMIFSNDEVGVTMCQNLRCCESLLLSKEYTFKNINKSFTLKTLMSSNSFNVIYVIICLSYLEEKRA